MRGLDGVGPWILNTKTRAGSVSFDICEKVVFIMCTL